MITVIDSYLNFKNRRFKIFFYTTTVLLCMICMILLITMLLRILSNRKIDLLSCTFHLIQSFPFILYAIPNFVNHLMLIYRLVCDVSKNFFLKKFIFVSRKLSVDGVLACNVRNYIVNLSNLQMICVIFK